MKKSIPLGFFVQSKRDKKKQEYFEILEPYRDIEQDIYPEDAAVLAQNRIKKRAIVKIQGNKENLKDENINFIIDEQYGFGLCAIDNNQTSEKYEQLLMA